ncbi:MAG: hypothetical protein ACE5KF_12590 [Kiloniellaceae bacterium]
MTNAQLAAKLLRNAASFFRALGEQNDAIKEDMDSNARTCDTVADLVESDPTGEVPEAAAAAPG